MKGLLPFLLQTVLCELEKILSSHLQCYLSYGHVHIDFLPRVPSVFWSKVTTVRLNCVNHGHSLSLCFPFNWLVRKNASISPSGCDIVLSFSRTEFLELS